MHAGLILAAVLSGPLFDADRSEAIQVSEVSIVTESEYSALVSRAPAALPAVETPDPPDPVQAVAVNSSPEVVVEAPEVLPDIAAAAPPEPRSEDAELQEPVVAVPDAPEEISSPVPVPVVESPAPRPAPRIDTRMTRQPENPSFDDSAPEIAFADLGLDIPEPELATGAPDTTTETVTEAEEEEEPTEEPAVAVRPRPRPVTQAQEIEPADEIAMLLREAVSEVDSAPVGAVEPAPFLTALSADEVEGLVMSIQDCWNVAVGVMNASDLVVVLGVDLDENGRVVGVPRRIGPPEGSGLPGLRQAFEAAERAVIRCQPYELPADKHDQWKKVEIEFNPEEMVLR